MRLPILVTALSTLPCPAALVAYWNFNNLAITSADSPGAGEVPDAISATQGSGTLDLGAWSGTVDDFAGTTLNNESSDPAEESLSLIAASGTAGNGGTITLELALTGMADPTLSFATQGTATGFNSVQLAWSTNGTDFFAFGGAYNPSSTYSLQSFDLSSVNALDGAATAHFQLTFEGATGSSGNNRIDNIQITAIPEPASAMLLLLGVGWLTLLRRR